ncbi:MAG TPA: AMP-binding protein [Terriglobales bacterium]|nr:AMP-binding protein [Terriglobales bacterium]
MARSELYADPAGVFLHDAVLAACRRHARSIALVDTSCARRVTYAEYGELVERLARGLAAAGLRPGETVALYLPNSWEFCAAFHAIELAGATPTPLNPSYREREVRYQLENSGAGLLISDGALLAGMDLSGLPGLRDVFYTRQAAPGARPFADLLKPVTATLPSPNVAPEEALAALPYSSGTTGLPKGVMLSHGNLVTNVYQFLAPGEAATFTSDDVMLCFLPLYHIYGLNVIFNPALMVGARLVLMPRFDPEAVVRYIAEENISYLFTVPPVLNLLCQTAEQGRFPKQHRVRAAKCGAAPLAADLPRRFTSLTGIRVRQGYGMTEASPVTHMGFLEEPRYRPDSIGHALARTECLLVDESGADLPAGEVGELVMRGPQFMLGYWRAPEATAQVLREGWYWSGDVALRDREDFFFIVDRRKELIKYKGFPVAPAEVEAVLLEHPAVRDCGVVGRPDPVAGEIPCAFVILREGHTADGRMQAELCGWVAERLTGYKQPREVRFVSAIPRNPSGKILRRELRSLL